MIAGALEFTLGLQANQFLQQIGLAGNGLLSFVGITTTIQSAFHKMWAAIERGGALHDLANKTNTSVKSLYQLQFAFEQVGASIEGVGPMILKLQRQMGSGEGKGALQSLGLDPGQLQGKESVDQIEAVIAALQKLNPAQQTAGAFKLFGREGGAAALQMARSGREFSDAIKTSEPMARVWQRVAVSFDEIGDKVLEIKRMIETGWAAAAGAFTAAFKASGLEGVSSLISDTIVAGFGAAYDVLPALTAKMGDIIVETLDKTLAPGLAKIFRKSQAGFEFAAFTARTANEPGREIEIERRRLELNLKLAAAGRPLVPKSAGIGAELNDLLDVTKPLNADSLISAGMASAAGRLNEFKERINKLLKTLPGGPGASGGGGASPEIAAATTFDHKASEVTNLERMGAVFGGLGRGFGQDHARATADNTRRTADLAKGIYDKITNSPTQTAVND